ncbi:MAG: hypothetical protein AB7D38_02330 [Sulfurimonas sp.]|uniref:WD40 domain-containing protein n=1 Tax=Sulfurimonas sp. TaxID=2022749 RepID=UPI003D0DCB4B
MFEITKSFKVSGSVLFFIINNNEIVVLTSQYLLLIFNKDTLSLIYKKQLSSKHEAKHIYDKSFAISKNLDFFVTISGSYKAFLLKYTDSLKSIGNIQVSTRPLYCARFNNAADILAIGGEDGKLFFYSLNDKKVVGSLKTKADFISSVAFSDDDKYIAVCSFDKTITIYSFYRACVTLEIYAQNVIEQSLFIDDNLKLIVVTRNKNFITYDLTTGISAESTFEFDEWPTAMIAINSIYTIVGTRGNSLYIINHKKGTLLSKINFDTIGITSLVRDKNHLYVSFMDGEIKIIDIQNSLDKFKLHLKLNQFSEASKLIQNNIFLSIDESAQKFDQEWVNVLCDAKKLIVDGKESEAKELVAPFFFDSNKRDEFLFCLGNIEQFKLFSKHIEEKNYIDAFKLADKHEFLKKSKDFDALEKYFLKIINHCKLLFAKNDPQSISAAKKILTKYIVVPSKRILVNNLMIKYKIFLLAEKQIKERNFKEYFQLVNQNKFLQEEELYNRVVLIGTSTFSKLNLYEQEQNYEKALLVAEYLKDFLPFKERIEKKINTIEKKKVLHKNIEENNIVNVYKLIQQEPILESHVSFLTFHETFLQAKAKAHVFANIGDVRSVNKILQEYLNVEYTLHLVAQEFKIAYLSQIRTSLKGINRNQINWEKTLLSYDSMFGIDNEIIHLLDEYDFNEEIPNLKSSDSFNGYETVGFLDFVIVKNI